MGFSVSPADRLRYTFMSLGVPVTDQLQKRVDFITTFALFHWWGFTVLLYVTTVIFKIAAEKR